VTAEHTNSASASSSHPLSAAFIREIESEFPDFRIVPKAGDPLSKAIDVALRTLTVGKQDRYLSEYHTVLGYKLYVPQSWERLDDLGRVILLRHERVHLRQRRRYGAALMTFLYLVPFAPLGLAWGRARIEWEAYTETLRATAELRGLAAAKSSALRAEIIGRFSGPDYGWMWPFPAQLGRWYDGVIEQIERERQGKAPPPMDTRSETHAR
jgi:hypothetical protein